MNDHSEARIGQERLAGDSCLHVVTVNRDDGFEITEGLSLQAIKSFDDEISALIDRQSHGNAWSRQIASPNNLARGSDPLGADFRKVGRHGQLSRIDGVKAAYGSDTDLEATMQLACRIVYIRFAPCCDRAPFDAGLGKAFGI